MVDILRPSKIVLYDQDAVNCKKKDILDLISKYRAKLHYPDFYIPVIERCFKKDLPIIIEKLPKNSKKDSRVKKIVNSRLKKKTKELIIS
ncbi:MAG: hypothetical protein OIF36_01730 [Alphaproteobacteria bacterium]|nr:hypothetical protein [Alphaproteobacteria bacterium]